MLTENDQEADQQLIEQPRATEEVHARAPTRPDQPGRDWNGEQPPLKSPDEPRRGLVRRHPVVAALGVPLLLLAGAGGYLYWDYTSHFETTDDAFIAARQFAIAPKVPGYITSVPVTDNQHSVAGQVIARIDDRDYRNALDEARAEVEATQASIQNIDAQIAVQQAQVAQSASQIERAQASLTFAQQQEVRYKTLARDGWGTVQNDQQWTSQQGQGEAGVQSSQHALVATVRQLDALKAQRDSATAKLEDATAQRDQATLNLSYTVVTAAQPGRLVNLTVAVGEYAQPGTNLSMFVPDDIWVIANFKETQQIGRAHV